MNQEGDQIKTNDKNPIQDWISYAPFPEKYEDGMERTIRVDSVRVNLSYKPQELITIDVNHYNLYNYGVWINCHKCKVIFGKECTICKDYFCSCDYENHSKSCTKSTNKDT